MHDHIDHCLEHAVRQGTQTADDTVREFKAITKFFLARNGTVFVTP